MNSTIRVYSKIITSKLYPVDTILNNDYSNILNILDEKSSKNLGIILPFRERKSHIYDSFRNVIRELNNPEVVTISLSGGVDSMVSSYILNNLSKNASFKVQAIMINYGNRKECIYEVRFVTRWCSLLGIDLYVRNITEISRNKCIKSKYRNLYEETTRFIRFGAYIFLNTPIFLAHNKDDCEENIITNIRKQRSYENLRGMSTFSSEKDCTIVRPMLNISKNEILEFAHKYEIPFLVNSTPSWCDRGRMREILIPFLNEFDSAFVPGLIKMSDNIKELHNMYEQSVLKEFKKTIDTSNGYFIPLTIHSKERLYGCVFWKDVVMDYFKSIHKTFPSSKSIETLTKRLNRNMYGSIPLNKQAIVIFDSKGLRFE